MGKFFYIIDFSCLLLHSEVIKEIIGILSIVDNYLFGISTFETIKFSSVVFKKLLNYR